MAGHDVTFSDYDENALSYAARNAKINGFAAAKTLPMNWRSPVNESFQLIIGADLTWDQDLLPAVVNVFRVMLKPGGKIWLTDQNRLDPSSFGSMLAEAGLSVTGQSPLELSEAWGWDIKGTFYEIRHDGS
jgi:16S rRNA G1207 methylase RsmC